MVQAEAHVCGQMAEFVEFRYESKKKRGNSTDIRELTPADRARFYMGIGRSFLKAL
jgi:hypothetical protein